MERWEDQPSATNDMSELRREFRERLGSDVSQLDRVQAEAKLTALAERAGPLPTGVLAVGPDYEVTRAAFLTDPTATLKQAEHGPVRVVDDDGSTRMVVSSPSGADDDGLQERVERLESALECLLRPWVSRGVVEWSDADDALGALDARKETP